MGEIRSHGGLICPYCQHEHLDDLHTIEEWDEDTDCESCEATFVAHRDVSVTYVSARLEDVEP